MNAGGHQDPAGRGIALMLGGLLLLTINDATAKWLTDSYPVPQIISLRGITILLPLVIIPLLPRRVRSFQTIPHPQPGASCIVFRWIDILYHHRTQHDAFGRRSCIYLHQPADNCGAGTHFVVGTRLGWRRWSAIIVGFAGVVVIARPTPDAFQWPALVALGAAFWSALRDMVTRRISAEESSDLILFILPSR